MAINGGLSAWWFHLAVVVTTHEFTNSFLFGRRYSLAQSGRLLGCTTKMDGFRTCDACENGVHIFGVLEL